MCQPFEKTLLSLDRAGSYWIFYNKSDNTGSFIIVDRTGPSITLDEGLGASDLLRSEKLQELDRRGFEESWYIDNFQAFEEECEAACSKRLGIRRPSDLADNKKDWVPEDIEIARGILCLDVHRRLQEKTGPMSKGRRDLSPDTPAGSKRHRPEDRGSSDLRKADTYRPREHDGYAPDDASRTMKSRPGHDRYRPEAVSQRVETRSGVRGSSPTAPSLPPGRETHTGVGRAQLNNRHEPPKEPVQQLRQGIAPAAVEPSTRQHDDSDSSSKRPSEDDGSPGHTSSTSLTHDSSRVSRGPNPDQQQRMFISAVNVKNPGVIPPMDSARVKKKPYIFVSSYDVPFNPTTVPHFEKMLRRFDVTVKADVSGYYILFPNNALGEEQLHQCHQRFDQRLMFNTYILNMVRCIDKDAQQKLAIPNDDGKLDGLLPRFEGKVDGPRTASDGHPALHGLAKADDEVSLSGALAPSEISSGATRAKAHCAECKNGHFPAYNPRIGCSSCQRVYHLNKCLKPPLRPNEDRTTWQCAYCLKKKRPKPSSKQQPDSSKIDLRSLRNGVAASLEHGAINENGSTTHGSGPEGPMAEPLVVCDEPDLAEVIQSALEDDERRHTEQMKEVAEIDKHANNGVGNVMQSIQQAVKRPSVLDAKASATPTVMQGSLSDTEYATLPSVALQSGLEPEIPDLSLEISESSSEEGSKTHDNGAKTKRRDAHDRLSRTSRWKTRQSRTERLSCTACGKTIYSVVGRSKERTCDICRNKKTEALLCKGSTGTHEAAGAMAIGGGPSATAKLARQPHSPVNTNTNNEPAGMSPDDAQSTTKDQLTQAQSGGQAVEGARGSSGTPAPVGKLPGIFTWPNLIGFALAEASDHRMTTAQVHQWIADNIEGYDIQNYAHRSSIAATLSQQKTKFLKAELVMEGTRQITRWMLAPDIVSEFERQLLHEKDKVRRGRSLHDTSDAAHLRRKSQNNAKNSHHSPNSSRVAHQQKEVSKTPAQSKETPMFIQRHRVAYDDDGREIVPGFKDAHIEKWTDLEEKASFRSKNTEFCRGDYFKAPLPNRFKFADYTHKPLVHTMAQIEEIRKRRDGPGYAVLVQWFITKEAAEWWKCRHVKSLWPKDDEAGLYVPATVWDVLTSDFILEQEKLDADETQRQIIPDMFFELDIEVWFLYLKEGRHSGTGIAFGPSSPAAKRRRIEKAGDTFPSLRLPDKPTEAAPTDAESMAEPRVTLRTKTTAEVNQGPMPPPSASPQKLAERDIGVQKAPMPRRMELFVESSPGPEPEVRPPLTQILFTPTPEDVAARREAEAPEAQNTSETPRSAPPSSARRSLPESEITAESDDEQATARSLPEKQKSVGVEDEQVESEPQPEQQQSVGAEDVQMEIEPQPERQQSVVDEDEQMELDPQPERQQSVDMEDEQEEEQEDEHADIEPQPTRQSVGIQVSPADLDPQPSRQQTAHPDDEQATTQPPPEKQQTQDKSPSPIPQPSQTRSSSDEQSAIRAFLDHETETATYDVTDLLAAAPAHDPATHLWDRAAKIAEIRARPTRKERFTQRLAYTRRERDVHGLHDEVVRGVPAGRAVVPKGKAKVHGDGEEAKGPKLYDSLEAMLGLPRNMIPTLYEGRLMFRDGTLVNGELKRAKERWAVGRDVPGELK